MTKRWERIKWTKGRGTGVKRGQTTQGGEKEIIGKKYVMRRDAVNPSPLVRPSLLTSSNEIWPRPRSAALDQPASWPGTDSCSTEKDQRCALQLETPREKGSIQQQIQSIKHLFQRIQSKETEQDVSYWSRIVKLKPGNFVACPDSLCSLIFLSSLTQWGKTNTWKKTNPLIIKNVNYLQVETN